MQEESKKIPECTTHHNFVFNTFIIDQTMNTADEKTSPTDTQEHINEVEDRFACNICFESVKSPVVTRCGHLYCWPCLYVWLEPGMNVSERRYLDANYLNLGGFETRIVDGTRRVCPVCKSPCSIREIVPIYVRECKQENDCSHEGVKAEVERDTSSIDGDWEGVENHDEGLDNNNLNGTGNNVPSDTGLRRRRTQPTTATTTAQNSTDPVMPSRPLPPPSSAVPSAHVNTTTQNNFNIPGQGHNAALALHQSLFQALVSVHSQTTNPQSTMMNPHQTAASQGHIPSIHNRNNGNNNQSSESDSANFTSEEDNQLDAAQEFLSRLVLMLGCFVILCLLLF